MLESRDVEGEGFEGGGEGDVGVGVGGWVLVRVAVGGAADSTRGIVVQLL